MDHLRWGVIILVVTIHAAVTYSGIGGWYYHEPAKLGPASLFTLLCYETHIQAFFMGLLFLVAGYFVPGAYDRKGALRFLKDRAVRLGAPTAFYALIIEAVIYYGLVFFRGAQIPPFWKRYGLYIGSLEFLSGTGPLWFALALLTFSGLYAAVRLLGGPLRPTDAPNRLPGHASVTAFIGGVALATFLVRVVQQIGTDVLNMQLCFFPQYVAMFIIGIMAYRRDWLTRVPRTFGMFWLRLALIAGPPLWLGALLGARVWSGDFSRIAGGFHWQSALYSTWESLFCAGVSLGLVVIFRDHFNRHTPLTKFLSDNSFAVYVLHPPIMIGLTMAVHPLLWPPLAKMVLLSGLSLIACYLVSHFVARQIPGLRRIL